MMNHRNQPLVAWHSLGLTEASKQFDASEQFAYFLAGTGFGFSHVVIIIAALAVLLLTWCSTNIDGIWTVVATVATRALGVATLFAFAGWIARSTR